MINGIGCSWDWIAFFIGLFGAFIMEFIRIIKDNRSFTELISVGNSYIRIQKVNKVAIFVTLIYIAMGGAISAIFAETTMEAFLYGVFWEALFTFAINNGGSK